jgi:glycosyltransferase involved in cell wall biosynthesis
MPQQKNKLKVVYQNRPKNSWLGGDYIQLEKTVEAIKEFDIETEINEQPIYLPAENYKKFDLVHLWNFSMKWTKVQMGVARMWAKPIVCSMIYHESDMFVPYNIQQIMLDSTDACIFLTPSEVDRVKRHLKIDDKKIHIIPNGVDKFWFNKVPRSKDYVLTVGRVEPHKGQLEVAKACKQLKLKYVMVGEDTDKEYLQKCIEAGAEWVGKKTGYELLKLYAGCSVFILASRAEVMPLVVMEAGCQAKNIVVAEHCEWKDIPNAEWCKYGVVSSIKKAILKSLAKDDNIELRDKLKKMTWDKVAKQIKKVYESVIMDKTK